MELWKAIPNTNGHYLVSSYGAVKSLARDVVAKDGRVMHIKERIVKQGDNGVGYKWVLLFNNGEKRQAYVHRLVAELFCLKPDGCNYVNHKDFNPSNNHADNLEWVTMTENNRYSIKNGRYYGEEWKKAIAAGTRKKQGKRVIGTNIATGDEVQYDCLNDCKKDGFHPSAVSQCCHGKQAYHLGYTWRYSAEVEPDERIKSLLKEWDKNG